ncbi:ADP-ribosylglycohydrolase [Neorhodopirellula lusitana]|uniref:ADP-ribosylglycohydrolase n=1 Tax=Neorhodopirellula lusitana TaxID=445327 RepID=A0ABY1QH40_9BACT|nr:ADP-ribosylglycohydrolase family protein [Neorhodopirellula lusitana]SMP70481.1 ADP-ribosylglycohydrolase [Neorhodopirellula lusitana]
MATYLLDFDGVFFRYGTMEPIEGAVDYVNDLKSQGHKVIFLTARQRYQNDPEHLTVEKTEQVLASLGVAFDSIVDGVSSPRVLVNDEGAFAINHPLNSPLQQIMQDSPRPPQRSEVVERVYRGLAAVSWVAWKYADSNDADDYVQTLLIGKSLTSCGGFDHADLVARYRRRPGYHFHGEELPAGGNHPQYQGQISKLLQSDDPLYQATDGVADGAAMKVTAAAAYYLDDFQGLIKNIDRVTRVTHATVDARLSAILVALRLRQVFLDDDPDNMDRLVEEMRVAVKIMQFGDQANFFLDRVARARTIATQHDQPVDLLYKLCRDIGMDHLAWSTPIAACFWSYHNDTDFSKWFSHQHEKKMYLPRRFGIFRRVVHGLTLDRRVHAEDVQHLRAIGQYDDFVKTHGYHWQKSVDIDTFLSIAISIIAVRHGLDSVKTEVPQAIEMFGDDLATLAEQLVQMPSRKASCQREPASQNPQRAVASKIVRAG